MKKKRWIYASKTNIIKSANEQFTLCRVFSVYRAFLRRCRKGKLRKAEYQSAIETLGIGRFMNNLTESQAAFEKVFSDRSQENLAKVSFDTKQLRKDLAVPYQQLSDYVAILAQLKEDAIYQKTLSVLNNSRKYYADVLARRKGKDKKEAKKVETETE